MKGNSAITELIQISAARLVAFAASAPVSSIQTACFELALPVAAALLLWAAYRIRVQRIAAGMKARFDERLAERNRLSTELQDAVLQSVQASLMIAELALQDESADMRHTVETLAIWLSKAASEGQAALNSLDDSLTNRNDLAEALRRAAEILCHQSSMELKLSVHGDPKDMHPIVRDDILRIGSHAIRNACFHSKGTHLKIGLSYGRDFRLRVRDNGRGFDSDTVARENSGLVEMRESARRIRARLRIRSRPDSGTDVELSVPGSVAFLPGRRT
jgi:signal transduction histidine kinase